MYFNTILIYHQIIYSSKFLLSILTGAVQRNSGTPEKCEAHGTEQFTEELRLAQFGSTLGSPDDERTEVMISNRLFLLTERVAFLNTIKHALLE